MSNADEKCVLKLVSTVTQDEANFNIDDFESDKNISFLLPELEDHRLIFLKYSDISGENFLSVIDMVKPSSICDLRAVPVFDKDILNRRAFFKYIKNTNTRYFDILGRLEKNGRDEIKEAPDELKEFINILLKKANLIGAGSVLFLLDENIFNYKYISSLSKIENKEDRSWKVSNYPKLLDAKNHKPKIDVVSDKNSDLDKEDFERKYIFISHANPEDNDFTLWLATRLRLLGYEVWCDLLNLYGGETFWEKIESVIREGAIKVIWVQSNNSLIKENVLNELDLALSVERSNELKDYILPVKIDSSEFDSVYIGLRRRMIVDFNHSWSKGFIDLISKLEKDKVEKKHSSHDEELYYRAASYLSSEKNIVDQAENLISNWYRIIGLPNSIAFYKYKKEFILKIKKELEDEKIPHVIFKDNIMCFVSNLSLNNKDILKLIQFEGAVIFQDYLDCNVSRGFKHKREDAYRNGHNLLRQCIELYFESKGLVCFELSSRRKCWFYDKDWRQGEYATFIDENNKTKRRKLVGESKRNKVFWHYAIEARPSISRINHFSFMAHVIFTEDGYTPISKNNVMHRLRRKFCKSWWNSKWRDLMRAFVFSLSEDSEEVIISCGANVNFKVSRMPVPFKSPVSIAMDSEVNDDGIYNDYFNEELYNIRAIDSELEDWVPDSDLDEYREDL